jgi:hypothetical protein
MQYTATRFKKWLSDREITLCHFYETACKHYDCIIPIVLED